METPSASAPAAAPLRVDVPVESLVGLSLGDLSIWQMHVSRADTRETLLNALYVDGTQIPSVDMTGIDAAQLRAKVRTIGFPPHSDELRTGPWIDATLPSGGPPTTTARARRRAKGGRR